MGRRNKLEKFDTILGYPNVIECFEQTSDILTWSKDQELRMNGQWKSLFFKNDLPITLELACGRGEYALQLGRNKKDSNFIGVDIKGARIWKGASIARQEGLSNVGFLRSRIEMIDRLFDKDEVDSIWITFPDPFHGKENRRLTAPSFIDKYKNFLLDGGTIHLKTDDDLLYDFTMQTFSDRPDVDLRYHSDDIYKTSLYRTELEYKTYYETMHLGRGKTIKYIEATLNH